MKTFGNIHFKELLKEMNLEKKIKGIAGLL